ncbi:MAG: TfoX/Sxy family protein [Chloroflexi bacterium]|nr:TfoX/Sxy family protein [Chloroflexota bacterium]
MAYDERLAGRIRAQLAARRDVAERKMFGGLTFMVAGQMCGGGGSETLMVRVGPEAHAEALGRPHARPMDFTGRALRGMVYVDPPGIRTKRQLEAWIGRGVRFVESSARGRAGR